jgi:hypothetical protein
VLGVAPSRSALKLPIHQASLSASFSGDNR